MILFILKLNQYLSEKEQRVHFQMLFYCINGSVSKEQELPENLKSWESCFSLSGRCVEHTAAGWH